MENMKFGLKVCSKYVDQTALQGNYYKLQMKKYFKINKSNLKQ